MHAILFLGSIMLIHSIITIHCIPVEPTTARVEKRSINTNGYYDSNAILPESRNIKKDVFISRGWGAGGMPFSVLYMSPYSSKAPMEQSYKPMPAPRPKEHHRPKSMAQISVRNSMGSVPRIGRKSYSIIPQLFVSYGWGPAGK